jgi:hypothetical protein
MVDGVKFRKADRNEDGFVRQGEFTAALRKEFGGKIDEDEFDEIKDQFKAAGAKLDFKKLANNDGTVNVRKLANALFEAIDKNDSGRVGRREWSGAQRQPRDSEGSGSGSSSGSGGSSGSNGSGKSDDADGADSSKSGSGIDDLKDLKFDALDLNGNGRIGAGEGAKALIKAFDRSDDDDDKDGELSGAELNELAGLLGVKKSALAGNDGVATRSDLEKFFRKEFKDGDFGKRLNKDEFKEWKDDKIENS